MTGPDEAIDRHLRTMRIIVLAMAAGVMLLSAVVAFMNPAQGANAAEVGVLAIVLAGLAIVQPVAYFVVRNGLLGALRRRLESSPDAAASAGLILQCSGTLTLIGGGLTEAFGLLGAVWVLISGYRYFLVAPAVAVLLLLMQVPTRDGLTRRLREFGVHEGM